MKQGAINCYVITLKVPLTQGSEVVSIVAHESEYIAGAMQSLYILLPHVVQNCRIGKLGTREENLENYIRGP